MKKVLITGGSGFIGRNLKEGLERKYIIYAPTHKELNLLNYKEVKKKISMFKPDIVIHAANTNNTKKRAEEYKVLNYNLQMFFNLERCNDLYDKMYYFGSGAEYDIEHYNPLMEENYFGHHIPRDAYGFSKYIMSRFVEQSKNIIDLRLFGVYGKYEEWERRFISNNICRVLKGLPISINQDRVFDYLYIDDLVIIMKWFLENEPKHKHYNVCTGKGISLRSIAEIIKEVCHSPYEIIVKMEGRGIEYTGSNKQLMKEIGKVDLTSIYSGVRLLYEYYKENQQEIKI